MGNGEGEHIEEDLGRTGGNILLHLIVYSYEILQE